MNDIVTGTAEAVTTEATVPAEAVVATRHFIVDPTTGEEIEVTEEVVATVTDEGEVSTTVH